MDRLEALRIKNGIRAEDMKRKSDKDRIKELEQENADLMDALIELADIVVGGAE